MLPSKIWGPITWQLLHTILYNCKQNDNYLQYKDRLYYIVKNICILSPCNISSYNASDFFNKINQNNLNKIDDLINVLYMFHNFINLKTNKRLFDYSNLKIYNDIQLNIVFNNFIYLYKNTQMKYTPNYNKMCILIQEIISFKQFYIDPIVSKEIIIESKTIVHEETVESKTIVHEETVESKTIDHEETVETKTIIDKKILEEDISAINTTCDSNNNTTNIESLNKTRHYDMFSQITFIDDKLVPSPNLSLIKVIKELKQNPEIREKDIPLYIERWKILMRVNYFKENQKSYCKPDKIAIDESLLPDLNISEVIAIYKMKKNPQCVPIELYIDRWKMLVKKKNKKKQI
jgi:hypothetical protein